MDREHRRYRILYFIAKITIGLIYPIRVVGAENIPSGAAVVCAEHSNWADPFLIAFALTRKEHLCMMAKIELFKSRLVGALLRSIGTFPVDRGKADMSALKNAMCRLRSGRKLGIFPEGTRVKKDGAVSPKKGAVRIAEKAGVPILPVHIPRCKKAFHRVTVIIGEPFTIEDASGKRTPEEYDELALDLMNRITALKKDA